jgi:diguanylate cyclase (GGDEF)-like protein/PAS domain S-box-containing protein
MGIYQLIEPGLLSVMPPIPAPGLPDALERGDACHRAISILYGAHARSASAGAPPLPELASKHTTSIRGRYGALLDAVPDAMLVIGVHGEIVLMNAQAARQFGYPQGQLIGQPVRKIIPIGLVERLPSDAAQSIGAAPAHKRAANIELVGRRQDGSEFPIELSFSELASSEGLLIAAAIRDISVRKQVETALRAKELQLSVIFDNTFDSIFVLGVEAHDSFRFISINPSFTAATGIRHEQVVGKLVRDIVPEPAYAIAVANYREAIQIRQPVRWEETSVYPAGKKVGAVTVTPVFDGQGNCTQLIGTVHDITERKQAEDRIHYLNRVYAVMSGISTLIVRTRTRDELFREACRIAVDAGGFRMAWIGIADWSAMKIFPVAASGVDESLMQTLKASLASTGGLQAAHNMAAQAIINKQVSVFNNLQASSSDGFGKHHAEAGNLSVVVLPLIVADVAVGMIAIGAGEIEFFREEELKLLTELAGDISFAIEYIDQQERLQYLAYYDALTGLANRSLFLDRVAQYMRSAAADGRQFALFLIDLERFKNINDSLGWPAGDALLKLVAQWLTRNAGDVNLVARVSADLFAVVMPNVDRERHISGLLDKLVTAFLEHPFHLEHAVLRIAAKGGVALFPDDGDTAETLFGNAEAALKEAKRSGVRYLFHTHSMTESVAANLTLENQLRHALDRDEFVLHFQPKVNLASGKLVGVEALIRWDNPRSGLVAPASFIPILEKTGMIHDVGRWALRQAIQVYLSWRDAQLTAVPIAVNVSPLQLHNSDFINDIRRMIGVDARAPHGLELEITENVIMENARRSIDTLIALRAMDLSVAIDDFGTGFSSLSYLAKLPVSALKIDRSFVVDMMLGPEGLALVSTIINLAHSLRLKVVAEGVESEEQARLLRLLNCDEMQGLLLSPPLTRHAFEARYFSAAMASA